MKRNSLLLCLLLLLGTGTLRAQEPTEPDSVVILGLVVNRISGEHEPFCQVHFLQGSDTVATAVCDQEGYFGVDRLPVGNYGLSVSLRGMTLYRSDLVLGDNAMLYLSVITDSFQLRNLHEVEITAPKHDLAASGLLITNPDDPRLWDFMYCDWCLWNGPPRNASASSSGDPNNPEGRVRSGHFYNRAKGSKMARIWQILWPDRILPAPKEKASGKKEEEKNDE